MSDLQDYKVTEDGFVQGDYYKKGDKIPMTPAQAKYLTAPHGDKLVPVGKPKTSKPAAEAKKDKG